MRILITIGYQKEPINKQYWEENGLGGSEYAVIKLAEQFAKNGHDVIVSGMVKTSKSDGVFYCDYTELHKSQHFDVVIATNYIHYLRLLDDLNITFGKSYFWLHNFDFYPYYNGVSLPNDGLDYLKDNRITQFIAVSDYQKSKLEKLWPDMVGRISVLTNAVDPSDWEDIDVPKFKNKFIYTSAADRGLENLLKIWPKIRKKLPDATLWVATPPYALSWYESYVDIYDGVHFLGNLPPKELYTQIKSAEFWMYPSQYDETYCITALEMMLGKVKVISTDTGNLTNLLMGKGGLISTPSDVELLKTEIFEKFEDVYKDRSLANANLETAYNFAKNENWDNRFTQWIDMIDSSNKLHPELYTYYDNPKKWTDRFITYSARTKEWDLIVDEPFINTFSFPLFTPEFCRMVREEAESSNSWTVNRHENYPTTDMVLQTIGMHDIYMEVLKEYVMPLSIYMWALEGKGWDILSSENFLARYTPDTQGHLSIHHDMSDITCLVQLSSFDEYEGGGTYFRRQKELVKNEIGYVTLHPGNITHKHGARAVTDGTRYIIVSFMRNTER